MFKYVFGFITALVSSAILTPLVIAVANKIGAIDDPTEERRVHLSPTPRLGGMAIFLSFLISASIFSDM